MVFCVEGLLLEVVDQRVHKEVDEYCVHQDHQPS